MELRECVCVLCFPGGHTSEILRLMGSLSAAYAPRHYVIADTDRMSEEKICTFESSRHHSESETQVHGWCGWSRRVGITELLNGPHQHVEFSLKS